jgi:sugar/nucleoside kinase (ribokinase family)
MTPLSPSCLHLAQVVDTVGAGDAFLAAFLLERLRGAPPATALAEACRLGAYVAGMPGATPPIDEAQLAQLQTRAAAVRGGQLA